MNEQPAVAIDAPFEPLVRRIIDEATVVDSRILKIDHFLNHRIEPAFMAAMGGALADRLRYDSQEQQAQYCGARMQLIDTVVDMLSSSGAAE